MEKNKAHLESDISDIVEKRLSLLRDSIELSITKEVDNLLKSRFDSMLRLLGVAFGLVALIFTAFGIKTIFDVREVASSTAVEEVRKKLAIDDPNSEFRRDVDKVVARGLIDSYMISLTKNKSEEFTTDLAVSESDFRRLQNLILHPDTSQKDFSDALTVILASDRGGGELSSRFIQSLAGASDEKYAWLASQPEKRAAIFSEYRRDEIVPSAQKIISSERPDKSLLISVIKYSAKFDPECGPALEKLASSKIDGISRAALSALARVDPSSKILLEVLERPKRTNQENDWMSALRLAIEVTKSGRRGANSESSTRENLTSWTLQNVIDAGYHFEIREGFRVEGWELGVSSRERPGMTYMISANIINGSSAAAVQMMFRRSAEDKEKFIRNVKAFCLKDDDQCRGVVRLDLSRGGSIELQNSVKIDKESAPAGLSIRPANSHPDAQILVNWTDADANLKSGVLSSVSGAEAIEFLIKSTRSLVDEE